MWRPFRDKKHEELVFAAVRLAVGGVFLWFGLDKFVHPQNWFGWVPVWVWPLLPFSPDTFMFLQGAVEAVIGALLILGRWVRLAALSAGVFLVALTAAVGANEITIRDGAMVGGCIALIIHANARARKPLSDSLMRLLVSAYAVFVFVTGVAYLR
jgi:uncharacterized membrane protein YphA (DoxX/SURF4 family)